ncbi:hypothetical protein [Nocardia salmonicida]|uniref:hypothetical protein n=1 Tax=Nocardia salmonicida TaxID=53431 RepID=UPI0037BA7B7C
MNSVPQNGPDPSMQVPDDNSGDRGRWLDLIAFIFVLIVALALVLIVVMGGASATVLTAAGGLIVAVFTAWGLRRR